MQVFFIIDSIENIDEKFEKIKNIFDCKICCFVKTSFYTTISSNFEIINSLCGVYNDNANTKINEYIHSANYEADDCVVVYASADLKNEFILELKNKISYDYDVIYVKNKETFFSKVKDKMYSKFISLMFNTEDYTCSIKFQYLSKKSMKKLIAGRFNNRILKEERSTIMYFDEKNLSLKEKRRYDKKMILSLIVGVSLLILFVVLEVFFKLKFYVVLAFILLAFLSIIVSIMFYINSIFKSRYGHFDDYNKK